MTTEQSPLEQRARRHAALGDVARLAVVDELVLGDRSPSELQKLLGLPSNLVAHHLKVLEDNGLVERRRSEGDRRRTYLTLTDSSALDGSPSTDLVVRRLVFVCSANSARSQLAAAMWTTASDVPVTSAGTHPAERIARGAREVAARHGLTMVSEQPQQFLDIRTKDDLVVAVCDNAYEELGASVSLHWSIPDPVSVGDDAAFDRAYVELDRRVATLASHLKAS